MIDLEKHKILSKAIADELPIIYIVHSDRKGVKPIVQRQVVKITKGYSTRRSSGGKPTFVPLIQLLDKYFLDGDDYPFSLLIPEDENSAVIEGCASGCGDLWQWSYFCTLSEIEAQDYFKNETNRIAEKYLTIPDNNDKEFLAFKAGWETRDKQLLVPMFIPDVDERILKDFHKFKCTVNKTYNPQFNHIPY